MTPTLLNSHQEPQCYGLGGGGGVERCVQTYKYGDNHDCYKAENFYLSCTYVMAECFVYEKMATTCHLSHTPRHVRVGCRLSTR